MKIPIPRHSHVLQQPSADVLLNFLNVVSEDHDAQSDDQVDAQGAKSLANKVCVDQISHLL